MSYNQPTPTTPAVEMIRIKTLVLGEGIQHNEIPLGSTVEDWLRTRELPDILMVNGISSKVNGEDRPLTYVLKNGDTVVVSPKKSEGGN